MRRLVGKWLILALILAGCALRDLTPVPRPASTIAPFELTPIGTIQVVGSCDDTPTLERWLQTSFRQREAFIAARNAMFDDTHGEALITMADIRFGLSRINVPDCAEQAHSLLLSAMTETIVVMEQFAAGQISDVNTALIDADGLFAQFDDVYQILSDRLDRQLRGDESEP